MPLLELHEIIEENGGMVHGIGQNNGVPVHW
jgi:hypothetical protein